MATIQLEVLNWDKYNPRKDVKSTSWFRKENSIFENADFFEFDHSELCFWDYVLCIASKKQSPTITINLSHAMKIGRFTKLSISSALEKLSSLQCVRVDSDVNYVDVTPPSRVRNATNERTATNADVTDERVPEPTARVALVSKTPGSQIWEAYSKAFEARYEVSPVRNAKTNSQCTQLAQRLGEDAYEVVRFYLTHNDSWYVKRQHDLGSLLQAAESVHSQWQRGTAVTSQAARNLERTQNAFDAFAKHLTPRSEP